MPSNRIAAVHITRDNIRLVEGRTASGVILITNKTDIKNAGQYYQGDRLVYLSEMVTAIVDAMTINGFTAKELYIVYDNQQKVEFYLDESAIVRNESKLANLTANFGKKGAGDDTRATKRSQIIHEKRWGRFITEAEQGEMRTTTVFERDFVEFIVSEFHANGYKVVSMEAPETAILYMRNMAPYSYNAMNKLVIVANKEDSGYFYLFTKDAPSAQNQVHFDMSPGDTFAERVLDSISTEMEKKRLYNPYIMLIGDAFTTEVYLQIASTLANNGLYCIDTYGTWDDPNAPLNSVRVGSGNPSMPPLDGYYGICLCLLARQMEAKPENMVEGGHFSIISKDTKNKLADMCLTLAIAAMVAGAAIAGISGYEYFIARNETMIATNATESKLNSVEHDRESLRAKVEALSTIDERYSSVLKFVYAQVDDNLNIASVDTEDMIPVKETEGSAFAEQDAQLTASSNVAEKEEGGNQDVTAGGTRPKGPQTIHIRGYSRTTDGPVELYTALVGVGLGEVRIVGIEQVDLPNGDTLFAFELTVGNN